VVDTPQQLVNCHIVRPFGAQTQVKVYGATRLPGAVVVSGTFQNTPGQRSKRTTPRPMLRSCPRSGVTGRVEASGVYGQCVGNPADSPMTQFEECVVRSSNASQQDLQLGNVRQFQVNVDVYKAC